MFFLKSEKKRKIRILEHWLEVTSHIDFCNLGGTALVQVIPAITAHISPKRGLSYACLLSVKFAHPAETV